MENDQGLLKINKYLCADDLAEMSMVIKNDETAEVDSGSDKNVQSSSET
jgi:hypothetical protein